MFDGSLDEVPNGEEETLFYKEIIKQTMNKWVMKPFVIVTKIDLFEEKLKKLCDKKSMSATETQDYITE